MRMKFQIFEKKKTKSQPRHSLVSEWHGGAYAFVHPLVLILIHVVVEFIPVHQNIIFAL